MQFEESINDDGFQSDQDQRLFHITSYAKNNQHSHTYSIHQVNIIPISPPQQIKNKSYSLQPDFITGWTPKITLPNPILLTFPNQLIEQLLYLYEKYRPQNYSLQFLGPRFNSTYSAWRMLGIEFPYSHLDKQKIIMTNRSKYQRLIQQNKQGLKFNSMFQSGNMDAVFKVGQFQYDCFMRVDANTRGHLQWYYFKVDNLKKNITYKFNICNFQKSKILYQRGMKPYIYIYSQYEKGWQQFGQQIQFSIKRSKIVQKLNINQINYLSILSFSITSKQSNDTAEIAYCPPYTYSQLLNQLSRVEDYTSSKDYYHRDMLCRSLGGLPLPIITITSDVSIQKQNLIKGKCASNKKLVFLVARIHPGQSNGSYMIQGFIKWICDPFSLQAKQLRNKYVFKIVPMMNPDGVVIGNYRTGLSGRDFNREFIDPDQLLFVQTYNLKKTLQKYKYIYGQNFKVFLDFHGHSIKKNVFAYGPQFPITNARYYQSRILPKILSKKSQMFRYYACIFKVSAGKAATARATVFRQLCIPFTFTIQASNGCYFNNDLKQDELFTKQMWITMGQKICQSLYDYWLLIKQIQQNKIKKKKQKQSIKKIKTYRNRKASTALQWRTNSKTHNTQRNKSIQYKDDFQNYPKNDILKDIFEDFKDQTQGKIKNQASGSQGKSDSQNSNDDFNKQQLKKILSNKKNQKQFSKKYDSQKKAQPPNLKLLKRASFITDFQDQNIKQKKTNINQKIFNKKFIHIKKKLTTYSNTPSPIKEDNGMAKVVNLSFVLNPVPITSNLKRNDEKRRVATQMDIQCKTPIKKDTSQYLRRTYITLQKDIVNNRDKKRMTIHSFSNGSQNVFRGEQIIGKSIFKDNP